MPLGRETRSITSSILKGSIFQLVDLQNWICTYTTLTVWVLLSEHASGMSKSMYRPPPLCLRIEQEVDIYEHVGASFCSIPDPAYWPLYTG